MPLAFSGSLCLSIIIVKSYENNYKLLSYSLFSLFFIPYALYASTGFEKVYEMRDQSYIKNMNIIHNNAANHSILKINLHYYPDYINLYYFLNFQKYENYLNSKYKNIPYYEFEHHFSNNESYSY